MLMQIKKYGKAPLAKRLKPFIFERTKTQDELQKNYGLEADSEGYLIARPYIKLAKYDRNEEEN